jgi:hypothetical protein
MVANSRAFICAQSLLSVIIMTSIQRRKNNSEEESKMQKVKVLVVEENKLRPTITEIEIDNMNNILEPVGKLVDGWCEHVNPVNLPPHYCFICDEEGRMKEKPLNILGTLLYNPGCHLEIEPSTDNEEKSKVWIRGAQEPIVGKIVIMKEVYGPEGIDLVGLNEVDILKILQIFMALIQF